MKNSHVCPKCQGRRLWHIEGLGAKDESVGHGGVYKVRVAAERLTPPTRPAKKSFFGTDDGSTFYTTGFIDTYLCAACGYTELWSRDFEKLAHNPEQGVHLIETAG